jgi:CheY-like chemotaxis protein
MSYPMNLQPLVIEDNDDMRDVYKEAFASIAGEFPNGWPFTIAEPCFAFSAEEASKLIAGPKIFHVVILDLGLPEKDNVE